MPDDNAHDGGTAHDGKNAESDAEGNAPGEFLRRGALLELVHDGANDPTVEAALWVEGHYLKMLETRDQKLELFCVVRRFD